MRRLAVFSLGLAGPVLAQTLDWRLQPTLTNTASFTADFDWARQRVVLFEGAGWAGLARTWEWKGDAWSLRRPATSPPPRANQAMAYDPLRQRIVLFGGSSAYNWVTSSLGDTWEWDGDDWTQRTPARSPSPRAVATMAFDYLAGRILMFGAANVADETWGWDGTSWSQLAAGPGTWGFHALASDPARGRVVLFGRVGSTATSNETWEWDGSAWTQLQPAAAPSFREGHRMTFVPQRQRVVLHGGYSMVPPNSILSDLWEWDGITWSLVAATGAPARAMHGMAHDPVRGRTMIVGGFEANDDPGDTWEWDGTSWSQRTAAAPCWSVAAIAYDSLRARLVAVDAHLGTLEWDGVHWLPGPPSPTLSWN